MRVLMTHRKNNDLFPAIETSTFASKTTIPKIDEVRFESSTSGDEFEKDLDELLVEIEKGVSSKDKTYYFKTETATYV